MSHRRVPSSSGASTFEMAPAHQRGAHGWGAEMEHGDPDASTIVHSNDRTANIRVVVRVRPLNDIETHRKDELAMHPMEDGQTIRYSGGDGKDRPITFNRVHNPSSTQEEVFDQCGVKDLLVKALDGYAVTVFAFGQTGSGKTFTITGPDGVNTQETQGLVPRALAYLFDQIVQRPDIRYTISAAYLEIYNEQVQDLLNPSSTSLPIRWTSEKGFYVENLFVVECEVLDDCFAVLEEGLRNRTVAAHALNEHSSRSHSIMTLQIDSEMTDPQDGRVVVRHGKVHFVDLAGSEKVKETKTQGETFAEALNINKGLLTLGQCISALAESRRSKNVHVPFRDSKLTKLLADSLGGRGLALMIACVSPSSYNIQESMKTLRYAEHAKRIKNKPIVQMDPREELILQLKTDLRAARQENYALKSRLGLDPTAPLNPTQADALSTAPSSRFGSEMSLMRHGTRATSSAASPTGTIHLLDSSQAKAMLQETLVENDNLKSELQELLDAKQQSDLRYGAALRDSESLAIQLTECARVMQQTFGSDEIMHKIRERALLVQASNAPQLPTVVSRMRGAGAPNMPYPLPAAAPPADPPAAQEAASGLPRRRTHSVVPNKQVAMGSPSSLRPGRLPAPVAGTAIPRPQLGPVGPQTLSAPSQLAPFVPQALPPALSTKPADPALQGVVSAKAQLIQDIQSIDAAIQEHAFQSTH